MSGKPIIHSCPRCCYHLTADDEIVMDPERGALCGPCALVVSMKRDIKALDAIKEG